MTAMGVACGSGSGSSPDASAGADAAGESSVPVDGGGLVDGESDAAPDAPPTMAQLCNDVATALCNASCTCTLAAGYCCVLDDAGGSYFCEGPQDYCVSWVDDNFCGADAAPRVSDLEACRNALEPSPACVVQPPDGGGRSGIIMPTACRPLYR